MEQILLRQLSSLQQERFQLTLRCNNKKMAIYRKQLTEYLLSNSLTVQITEQQDNLLVADKIQILSETRYSNNTVTKETLYTGSYCTSVFQYVLSHCKLKCSKNEPLSGLMLKFKIEPIIRFEYHLTGKKKKDKIVKRKDKKEEDEAQKGNEIATQRNSVKSNRHLNSHRRNEEDESMNPSQHYHGRKCYCCSNRSQDSDQPESPNNLFCRSPTKTSENKENSYTRSSKVGQFGKNSKKSPQSQTHPLSIRGNSSQSDRNKNSPSLYFRKHLQTIANKKVNDDSNRNTKLLTNQKPTSGEGFTNSEQNNWIKTKRNQEGTTNKGELDNNRVTQIKQGNKFSNKIPRNDDKLFHRSYKQKQENQFKDQENFKEPSNNKIINQLQTMKNSFNMTKTEIEQRYSQISPPMDYSKLQTLGGYSHDEKNNNMTYASMQKKINHQRNQSLESWFKGKKELDPISKMMRNNEKNSSEGFNKSSDKGNVGVNRIISEKDNLFFEKSFIKAEETSKTQSNRIKKIPLTQKMQMLKQNQERQKPSQRVQAEKIENEPTEAVSIQKREIAPKKTSNSKQIFRSPSMPLKRSERVINRSTKPSIITTKAEQIKQQECKEPQSPHEDDNFSVTQQKIDKQQANNLIRFSQKEDCTEDKQSKLEKDLATTIKQISYNDQLNLKEQNVGKQENTAQVTENSRVNTSRTIPFRNDIPTPSKQQEQERKSQEIIEKEEERQSQQREQREYFDNLLAQNTENEETPITNEPQTTQVVYNDRSPIKMFNNCQSEQLIERQMPSKQVKVSANSTAFIQPQQQSILGQEEFKSDLLNQSVPSQFSSTKQLKVKEDSRFASKSRISIDSKFPLGIDPQAINKNNKSVNPHHSQNNFVEKGKDSQSNNNILSENNLEQFEKQLFDVPKPNEKERQIVREDSKKAKQFLRLETIDEVNESIYRQSDKKDIEEKSINASVSSLYSSKCSKGKDDHVVSQKFVSEKSVNNVKDEKLEMEKVNSSKSVESKNLNEEAQQEINEAILPSDEMKCKQDKQTSQIEEQSPQLVENKQNLSRLMSDCASEEAQQQEPIQQNHQQTASLNNNEANFKEQCANTEQKPASEQKHEEKKDAKLLLINHQPLKQQRVQLKGDVMAEGNQRQQSIIQEGKQTNKVALSFSETKINKDNEEIQVQNKQNEQKFSSQIINQNFKVGNSKQQKPVQEEQSYIKPRNTLKEPKKTQINKKLTEQTEVNQQLRQSENPQKKLIKSIEAEEAKLQAESQAMKVEDEHYNETFGQKFQQDCINIPLDQEQSFEEYKVKQEKHEIQKSQAQQVKTEKQQKQGKQERVGKQVKQEDKVSSTLQKGSSHQADSLAVKQKSIVDQKKKEEKTNSQDHTEEKSIIVTNISASNDQMPHQQQSSHQPIKSDRLFMKSAESNPLSSNTFESKQVDLDKPIKKVSQQRKQVQDNLNRAKSVSDKQQVKQQKKIQQANSSKKQVFEQKDNVLHEVKQTQTNLNSNDIQQSSKIIRNNIEVQTDYILPNEQPENEEFSVYKSQSDHLSKKKCKINLCQPQIVNSYQKFGSAAEITSQKHLKKKNRMETKVEREQYRVNEKSSETNIFNMENENDIESEGKRQAFQPLSEKYEPQAQAKTNKVGNSRDMEPSNQRQKELQNSKKEQERQMHQTANNPYNLKLEFKEDISDSQENHPSIINKLIYKNVKILSFQKIIHSKAETQRKLQIIGNCLFFVDKYIPNFLSSLTNNKKTEICLFINNQWTLFKDDSKQLTLENLLLSQLEEQSIFKCLEMLTGMPMRILKDKEHEASKKRLIKSVKTLLQKRDEQKTFETVLYGLNKFNQQIISLQKVRYFLDNAKVSRSILQCKKIHSKKNEQLCNFQGDIINEFIQVFLIKHPRYLTLEVDNTTMNTYQIELTNSIFYVSGNYKFILYEETAKNQYKLTKESFLWLKHKNQQQLTKYLLILEPIPDKKGQTIITMRLATSRQFQEGSHTNRVVKYENGGKAKGYQGGYENQKNLYLPVVKEIIKNQKKGI